VNFFAKSCVLVASLSDLRKGHTDVPLGYLMEGVYMFLQKRTAWLWSTWILMAACQNQTLEQKTTQALLDPSPSPTSYSSPNQPSDESDVPAQGLDSEPDSSISPVPSDSSPDPEPSFSPTPIASALPEATVKVVLSQNEIIRTLKGDILEIVRTLPRGTELTLPRDTPPGNYKYRLANGTTETSSNYFFTGIKIQLLPNRNSEIDELHAIPGGLYLSSTIADDVQDPVIAPVKPGDIGAEYLKSFSKVGKPSFQYSSYFKTRFGSALNKVVIPGENELAKSQAIFAQLRGFATREEFVDAPLYFIPLETAKSASILFEQKGIVHTEGAWSIAVKATAPRHGFPNVPCAEFVSEVIRQSYARAGHSHFSDYSAAKGNELIWSKTAAVVTLADHLAKAGWIPWEAFYYQPPAGAPVMHYKATTPGHAYLSGVDGGQIIVDNGAPRGRDLRVTNDKYIRMMYMHGVFFLPPGIIPNRWDDK